MSIKIKTGIDPNGQFKHQQNHTPVVDVEDEESLRKWGEVLHLSREELIAAVKSFGPKVRDIRLGLAGRENKAA